jgi:hypothetical protein
VSKDILVMKANFGGVLLIGNIASSILTKIMSLFWKSIILAARSVKLGYKWMKGSGKKIHFS